MVEWQTCLPAGRRARFRTMYFVYILQSQLTGEFYKGMSGDINQRITEHEKGKVVFTKNRLPIKLIYAHECENRKEAREWERFFKSGIGRETINELARVLEWQTGTA
ncbi:MAG: GIY-YIG nuclease family protein [Patescibacteria group bacterium]|nr:GIY-YIG nuclease family protein [Patescibacteria group bacterium]MCL5432054.1 GIY-YIG nuclease family protein [Patescibacteria group bacterium]